MKYLKYLFMIPQIYMINYLNLRSMGILHVAYIPITIWLLMSFLALLMIGAGHMLKNKEEKKEFQKIFGLSFLGYTGCIALSVILSIHFHTFIHHFEILKGAFIIVLLQMAFFLIYYVAIVKMPIKVDNTLS